MHPEAEAERPTQAHVRRRSRQRVHSDMLTVAIRGPLAAKMRQLAETTSMSLARLLGDMALACEGEVGASMSRGRVWPGGEAKRRPACLKRCARLQYPAATCRGRPCHFTTSRWTT